MISFALALIVGLALGYFYRDLKDKVVNIQKSLDKKEVKPTVTMGAYVPPKARSNTGESKIGLISSKTPQRLEWEAQERLEKEVKGIPQ